MTRLLVLLKRQVSEPCNFSDRVVKTCAIRPLLLLLYQRLHVSYLLFKSVVMFLGFVDLLLKLGVIKILILVSLVIVFVSVS